MRVLSRPEAVQAATAVLTAAVFFLGVAFTFAACCGGGFGEAVRRWTARNAWDVAPCLLAGVILVWTAAYVAFEWR